VKTNASKWYFDTAKNLIVEWLSIDKFNKELNLQLWLIYEKEKNYSNAEYIYKELLDNYNGDYEIMKSLWYILAVQNKLTESLLIYELLHTKKKWDNKVIEIIADLSFTLENYKKALKFTTMFLAAKPRNIEKLTMRAICLDNLWEIDESIDVYKRILELQPYNTKVKECLELLEEKKKELDKK
jgi:tetratricopeptide (TPR) repeat protein